jgi:hypothetical protein
LYLPIGRARPTQLPVGVDRSLDQWVYALLAAIQASGARRVLIDSLGDLLFAAGDQTRDREDRYSLVQRCSRRGVRVLLTLALPDLFPVTRLSSWASPMSPTTSSCSTSWANPPPSSAP